MSWHKVTISSEQVRNRHNLDFVLRYPIGFALFEQKEWHARDPFNYYIPPNAFPYCQTLIAPYSVEACPKPDASEVAIAIGGDEDWDLLK